MTLTPEQLERVRDYALGGGIDGDGHPLDPIDADLAAMRTPITAESLTAAGWETTYDTPDSTCFVFKGVETLVDVVVSPHGTHVYANDASMDDPRGLPNVQTMHDLRELVRLLGGAK